jgi:hypothetical protein
MALVASRMRWLASHSQVCLRGGGERGEGKEASHSQVCVRWGGGEGGGEGSVTGCWTGGGCTESGFTGHLLPAVVGQSQWHYGCV